MKMGVRFLALAVFVAAAACGGSTPLNSGSGDLVGVWTRYQDDGTTVRDRYTLNADGTFRFDETKANPAEEDHVTGTWRRQGSEVVGEGTNSRTGLRGRLRATFYVNASQLVVGALLRVGSGTGIVGVFTGTMVGEDIGANGEVVRTTNATGRFEFRADKSVTATVAGTTRQATWEERGDSRYRVLLSSSGGINISTTFTLIDDNALAGTVYRR